MKFDGDKISHEMDQKVLDLQRMISRSMIVTTSIRGYPSLSNLVFYVSMCSLHDMKVRRLDTDVRSTCSSEVLHVVHIFFRARFIFFFISSLLLVTSSITRMATINDHSGVNH